MKQLSGLDATFLYLETPEMPMHVGALALYELPAGYKGRWVRDLRKHMASRMPIAGPLRRKLWWMPLNLANPAWIDAEVDLEDHIVEIKLPPGSGIEELQAQVNALHCQLLDRKRPLWKFHVFEGLAPSANGNKRVAMYSQLHHAAVDGQAAVALANAILDVSPIPREIEVKPSGRARTFKPEMTEMLRAAFANQVQQVSSIVKGLPSTVGTLKDAASLMLSRAGTSKVSNLALAPATALNVSVSDKRAFAAVSLPLPELKALGRAHEATLNDLVLMLCSSALRRFYSKKRQLPRKSMVAAVPISLREKGDTTANNQASMSLVSLGTQVADPAKRLAHIKAATAAMKATMGSVKSILPTDFPSLGVPWLMEAATALYGRAKIADRIPQVANLVISNVPGPPIPLYLAGARMLANYPTSIVVHGMGLNITLQSYDQQLDFGLMADAQAMPDVAELAQALHIAFDDLKALPVPGSESPPGAIEAASTAAKRAVKGVRGVTGAVAGAVTGAVTGVVSSAVGSVSSRVSRVVADSLIARASQAVKRKASAATQLAAPAKRAGGATTAGQALREAVTKATKRPRASAAKSARRSR
jgi:diacylglycerol O-acyltransferase / wax synthase